jgi:hypothetical protein
MSAHSLSIETTVDLEQRAVTDRAYNILQPEVWQARQSAHEARVRAWTDPHQARAKRREKHPVYDFLFSYYSFRPSWLRRWHPGPEFTLAGDEAAKFLNRPEYRQTPAGVALNPSALPAHRRESVAHIRGLLAATQTRPAFFGCFGIHEWAMVYRQQPEEIRHNAHSLRFPAEKIARIVEANSLCCTHFDAFRFFTAPARPLNSRQLTRQSSTENEQRGCLHANMDLYKWAFKLFPFTPSELVADCFELARDIRELDMRASPYDLRELGFLPVAIETAEGRLEYEREQRKFASRSEPLREQIISVCDWLLQWRNVEV